MENVELENLKGKNWVATMTLAWFLGTFGCHRFYTGKTYSGWAMLIMTITGCLAPISAVWALIDGVVIALGQFRHQDGSELYERIPWVGYAYIIVMILLVLLSLLYASVFIAFVAAFLHGDAASASAAANAIAK